MPKKINWTLIRDDFIQTDLTYLALASRHSISRQAIEKRGASEGWQALRQAFQREQSMRLENIEKGNGTDFDSLLTRAIALAFSQLETAPAKSFEGAADAFCKLAEVRIKTRPVTVRQWAEVAIELNLPAKELFEEIDRIWPEPK